MQKDAVINIVVSSEHHIPRVRENYNRVLGGIFSTDYVGVPITLANVKETDENERRLLEIFRNQFGQVKDEDSLTIEAFLYSVHDLYKDLPRELSWRKGISPVKRVGVL